MLSITNFIKESSQELPNDLNLAIKEISGKSQNCMGTQASAQRLS